MLEYKKRNGNKHIVSDNELNAFAWAGYYGAGVRRFGMLKKWNWSKAAYFQLLFWDGNVILYNNTCCRFLCIPFVTVPSLEVR